METTMFKLSRRTFAAFVLGWCWRPVPLRPMRRSRSHRLGDLQSGVHHPEREGPARKGIREGRDQDRLGAVRRLNKALEFLNAGSIDFGSTAGSAALVAKINGNPIKSVYVYSRPEWTALVTGKDSKITKVADLKGKRVAVTRGTDPHIFLVRALLDAGLTDKDITPVLLQHADGKAALIRGDVDAWAGLDPMMAQAEVEDGAKLFYPQAGSQHLGHPQCARTVPEGQSEDRAARARGL
jgi:hypothetical protein